jgi:Zn-dependent M28 family amino/carboxypeptidase
MALTLLAGLLGAVDWLLAASAPGWSTVAYVAGVALSLVLLFLAWGLGLNLVLGRFIRPSTGAVDNGAACAVLAGLAERLAGEGGLQRTAVTLAFFTGEEANMQGSRAYVGSRAWPRPAIAVNLEVLGQNGGYVLWEHDGTGFRSLATAAEVNALLAAAVEEVTGQAPQPVGTITSDAASFLARGIPTAVLGTADRALGLTGFHRPSDTLERVVLARLPEAVDILVRVVRRIDELG